MCILHNSSVRQVLWLACFNCKRTEAERGQVNGPRSHSSCCRAEIQPLAVSPEDLHLTAVLYGTIIKGDPWPKASTPFALYPRPRVAPRNLHFNNPTGVCCTLKFEDPAGQHLLCAGHSASHTLFHSMPTNALISRHYFHFSTKEMEISEDTLPINIKWPRWNSNLSLFDSKIHILNAYWFPACFLTLCCF